MAVINSYSEATILSNCKVALTNVQKQKLIAAEMAEFGYDAKALKVGKSFLDKAQKTVDDNIIEGGEGSIAYAVFAQLKGEIEKDYALLRKKAKVIFRNDPLILNQLGLYGEVARVYVSWIDGVRRCCTAALQDDTILVELVSFKVAKESLNAILKRCDRLDQLRAEYLKEKGEAHSVTIQRDQAFAELEDWMREFYTVAKIALDDKPQMLESLGVFGRN